MNGKVSLGSRTIVPKMDKDRDHYYKPGNVTTYRLSEEELAKYRALPKPTKPLKSKFR
jgi:hypothetical protein